MLTLKMKLMNIINIIGRIDRRCCHTESFLINLTGYLNLREVTYYNSLKILNKKNHRFGYIKILIPLVKTYYGFIICPNLFWFFI